MVTIQQVGAAFGLDPLKFSADPDMIAAFNASNIVAEPDLQQAQTKFMQSCMPTACLQKLYDGSLPATSVAPAPSSAAASVVPPPPAPVVAPAPAAPIPAAPAPVTPAPGYSILGALLGGGRASPLSPPAPAGAPAGGGVVAPPASVTTSPSAGGAKGRTGFGAEFRLRFLAGGPLTLVQRDPAGEDTPKEGIVSMGEFGPDVSIAIGARGLRHEFMAGLYVGVLGLYGNAIVLTPSGEQPIDGSGLKVSYGAQLTYRYRLTADGSTFLGAVGRCGLYSLPVLNDVPVGPLFPEGGEEQYESKSQVGRNWECSVGLEMTIRGGRSFEFFFGGALGGRQHVDSRTEGMGSLNYRVELDGALYGFGYLGVGYGL